MRFVSEEEGLRIADKLCEKQSLSAMEYERLILGRTPRLAQQLARAAQEACKRTYGDAVYGRGLIEFTNCCRNDCRYCGLRRSNLKCRRYRLGVGDIVGCAVEGYRAGFRSFVLQGGEDPGLTDEWLSGLVQQIKSRCPGCAVTLSVGERSPRSYQRLRATGADRYLLRHETASPEHYRLLHPAPLTLARRLACLESLREAGFAVGAGFMVGSPGQTAAHLAADLAYVQAFRPEMCGIGPFIPQQDTPFAQEPPGSVELTCYLLSILRVMLPSVLLPATTALETLDVCGREKALQAGANVVMPNLTPPSAQECYRLYDGKPVSALSAQLLWSDLEARAMAAGRRLVVDRGDPYNEKE